MKLNHLDSVRHYCRRAQYSSMVMLLLVLTTVVAGFSGCSETTRDSETSRDPEPTQPPGSAASIVVDTLTRFQTMTGWEAVAQAGQEQPGFAQWGAEVLDAAVNDLGINRIRLEVRSGSENTSDYFKPGWDDGTQEKRCARLATVNDNIYPQIINPNGFHFGEIDSKVSRVVLPIRDRLVARGERLFLSLTYVAFVNQCRPPVYVHENPDEYAEFILATFLHLRSTYGLVPDAVEIILEPNTAGAPWNGNLIGRAIVTTSARLAASGFNPVFVAPSSSTLASTIQMASDIFQVPGVKPHLREISYHRYGGGDVNSLTTLADLAASHGVGTAMLEHIGSGAEELYTDITVGQVSAWEQFTLAFGGPGDGGGTYFRIVDGRAVRAERTRYLRQYFKYVRLGARRVKAESADAGVRPVAFRNADGRLVVVMHIAGSHQLILKGLSAGTYGASVTTLSATGTELGDRTIAARENLTVTVAGPGIVTVYRK